MRRHAGQRVGAGVAAHCGGRRLGAGCSCCSRYRCADVLLRHRLLRQPGALNWRSLDAHLAVEVHEVITDPQPAQAVAPELEELEALERHLGAGGAQSRRLSTDA